MPYRDAREAQLPYWRKGKCRSHSRSLRHLWEHPRDEVPAGLPVEPDPVLVVREGADKREAAAEEGGGNAISYVFGPVPSRRLGRSLGVDVVPFKTCSYDCSYCSAVIWMPFKAGAAASSSLRPVSSMAIWPAADGETPLNSLITGRFRPPVSWTMSKPSSTGLS